MADKTKKTKKPRHTRLVLPGDRKRDAPQETDRLGRALTPGATAGTPDAPPTAGPVLVPDTPPSGAASPAAAAKAGKDGKKKGKSGLFGNKRKNKGLASMPLPGDKPTGKTTAGHDGAQVPTRPAQADELPPNAIPLPTAKAKKKKRGLSPVRRKRRRRRIQVALLVVLVALGILVYQTGAHLRAMNSLAEWWENISISSRPGDGFPMPLSVTGFVRAQEMPGNGFAALGKQDMAIVSSTGAELRRIQHSYLSPGVSAGATKVVVFSRGGREYTIEGRSETIAKHNTTQDIAFALMSRGGTLALATTSRFSSKLIIMDGSYNNMNPELTYNIVSGETPFMAAFLSDDHSLVLACTSNNGGVMGTTFHLLRTGTDSVIGSFRVDGAVPLRLEYLSGNRILAVFDSFTALYDTSGTEVARYDYAGRSLYASDTLDGRVALVFGSAAQDTVHIVLLDGRLDQQFDLSFPSGGIARALLCADGLYLLAGQEVLALDWNGAVAARLALEYKPLALVRGGKPLAVTAGRVEDLTPLFHPEETGDESVSPSQSLSESDGSASIPSSAPESAPDPASTSTSTENPE